ncbi:cysteine hydrolase family protein [Microbulbifer sp. SSSA008]|uniref:cysteine hydrolase family protein n=1 Tax=Microbulbifer sp. SSSA008 TaxID=3243380 RepID=UPI004039AE70
MNKALLIIDMQNDFVLPGAPCRIFGAYSTISKVRRVLEFFRKHNLPIFHVVREYREDGSDIENFRYQDFMTNKKYAVPNTPGCKIIDELQPFEGEYKIIKNRFSGFMNTELDSILRRLKINELVVTGTQYPNCVRATVYDAVCLHYEVTIITDATSAQTIEIAKANIVDMKNIGVKFLSSDELIRAMSP